MKTVKFSESKILEILKSKESGKKLEEICREHSISQATFYNWKKKYGEMEPQELRRLRDLESENKRLKKLLAEKSLDYDILEEGYERLKKL